MTNRRGYLRAMVEGVFGPGPVPTEALDQWRPGLLAALDQVEPLIRADEQERIAQAIEAQHQPYGGEWCCFDDQTHARLILDARIARNGGRDE